MKFEYETKEDDRECVAYIDYDGDLRMPEHGTDAAIVLVGGGVAESRYDWNPDSAIHKFYPGDKVTITF